ncbi:hypothetical protein M406DRAFT_327144 [Cryphonectria parasitica EP155]|uniref:Uncharacterized protein n=1 Tax=Cryphonectria parasitica (strain ATCC 38755 / EP155) TaxID=660469 RepID=A0A9P5CRM3_CRYP1|nr:uncharacterized protein M406DRAFT_327144 [Cryphonectria parasitica EP155]KAF3768724.1 hypothetical protein M406DRAFT_327144 [Cryphonectria parasitica EP155]
MKLTPIRVRGRRGQHKPTNTAPSKTKQPIMTDDGQGRRDRLQLHKLPQEILEVIFVASRNLSLPLVNSDLYNRLSSPSAKYQLVSAAFGLTWDTYYGLDAISVASYNEWWADEARIIGDPAFQSAILRCSWANFTMMITSLEVWTRQHARGRAYFTIPGAEERTMTMPDKFIFDFKKFEHGLPSRDRFRNPNVLLLDQEAYLYALLGSHMEVHPRTQIPDNLLSGPFESEDGSVDIGEAKMRFLFWLVRGGACLQAEQNWEVLQGGVRAIVKLITGAGGEATLINVQRRFALATQLFSLYNLLGVFEAHWPDYSLVGDGVDQSMMNPGSSNNTGGTLHRDGTCRSRQNAPGSSKISRMKKCRLHILSTLELQR